MSKPNLAPLPEELLHSIVESLAFQSVPPDSEFPEFELRHVSSELLSISLTTKQLRRICLPLLFGYTILRDPELINIDRSMWKLTKMLSLYGFSSSKDQSLLSELLPRLSALVWIDLRGIRSPSAEFLNALQKQKPMVKLLARHISVLPKTFHLKASQIVLLELDCCEGNNSWRENWLAQGMSAIQVRTLLSHCLEANFGHREVFHALQRIVLEMRSVPFTLSPWLSQVAVDYPLLFQVKLVCPQLLSGPSGYIPYDYSSVLSYFVNNLPRERIDGFHIDSIIVSRMREGSTHVHTLSHLLHPLQTWHVTEVRIRLKPSATSALSLSLIKMLLLINKSCPDLDTLAINLQPDELYEYDPNELVSVLGSFHSLQTIHLAHLAIIGEEVELPYPRTAGYGKTTLDMLGAKANSKFHLFLSNLSSSIPSLRVLYLKERECRVDGGMYVRWELSGWIDICEGGWNLTDRFEVRAFH
ncbi:hypothetical protein D9757_011570 [Collybiopsis confluens]|uniref:Uncharacterized protein n=1 Tax=Collybiopsis confluens TaxID=2823264 RepID=A0A8H5GNN7_9AGAR|nr:hypothetical protein D9757_011570 [Collybiopsis confluens]